MRYDADWKDADLANVQTYPISLTTLQPGGTETCISCWFGISATPGGVPH